jgi:ribose-phosphate pyrophosphokinase
MKEIKIFGLSNSQKLAGDIAYQMGLPLGELKTDVFSDSEMTVYYNETIRKREIYIVGSTNSPQAIMEMMLAIDAAKRAGAKAVNVVIPYFGYSRQDRKDQHRGPISAKVMATMLESVGMDSLMTIDLHSNQIEGFFSKPVVHIQGSFIFTSYLKYIINTSYSILSPDQGGIQRATMFSNKLKLPLVMMNKRRDKPGSIKSMELVGDVEGKRVLLVDDIIDSGGSLSKAVDVLIDNGAVEVNACITHPVLSGKAFDNINNSKLTTLFVGDTIPMENRIISNKIKVISTADSLAKIITRINNKQSVNQLQQFIE